MYKVEIEQIRCKGCGDCTEKCPTSVFDLNQGKAVGARMDDCMACRLCETVCPEGAITIVE